MNAAYFIAKRFAFDKTGKKNISRNIVRISVFSISVSLAVMLISIAVVTGFKKEIRNKVVAFGSHIQIINFDSNNSFESVPISSHQDFLPDLKKIPGIRHVQVYAIKPGIIKSKHEIQGVLVKGIGPDSDPSFFEQNRVEGRYIAFSDTAKTNDVMLSKKLAALLRLKLEDDFTIFFIDERPRMRRFHICGIYETSLEDFDKQFIFADIAHIQKLYNWKDDQISGFEILISDYRYIDQLTEKVRDMAGYQFMEDGSRLRVTNIKQRYPQIFDWLGLLNMNVVVILFLMILVAVINMISGLIILILDRTHTIGLLKALGASNKFIKNIFLYESLFLIVKGLFIGNALAFLLCFVQDKFQLLKLNQASYFINFVPVNLTPAIIILTNLGSLMFIFLAMFFPVLLISRIDPVKTLRYD